MSATLDMRVRFKALGDLGSTFSDLAAGAKKLTSMSDKLKGVLGKTGGELKQLQQTERKAAAFQGLRNKMKADSDAMIKLRERARQLEYQLKTTAKPTQKLRTEFDRTRSAVTKLEEKHRSHYNRLSQLQKGLKDADFDTRNFARSEQQLKGKINQTNYALSEQSRKLRDVADKQRKLQNLSKKYESSKAKAQGAASTGTSMLIGGGVAAYTGGRLMQEGVNFDAKMSKVMALTKLDAQSAELAQLRQQAKDLGATTRYTASDVASGQGFLGMAGFNDKQIKTSMPALLDLTTSGGGDIELARVADIASNILGGMNMGRDEMRRVADVMAATTTSSNTNIEQMGDAMSYASKMAAEAGAPIEELAAMTGILGDVGIQGSRAGTALKAIYARLAAPPKMASDALNQLGIETKDKLGNLRAVPTIMAELYEKTKNLGSADRMEAIRAIAGLEAAPAFAELLSKSNGYKILQKQRDLEGSGGSASRLAKDMDNNAEGDVAGLSSAWQSLKIETFEANKDSIRTLIKAGTELLRIFSGWVSAHPKLVGTIAGLIAVFATLVAGIGALVTAAAGVVIPILAMRFAMAKLGVQGGMTKMVLGGVGRAAMFMGKLVRAAGLLMMANPIILAVTLLATAVYLIYKNWEPIKAFFTGLWGSIKSAFGSGVDWIKAKFEGIMGWFGSLKERFFGFGSAIIGGLINGLLSRLGAVKDAVVGIAGSIAGRFKNMLGIRSPSRLFKGFGGFITQGLALGIAGGTRRAVEQAKRLSQQVAQAGQPQLAGFGVYDRSPISSSGQGGASSNQNTYKIEINAAPGMDPQAIARAVSQELDRRDRAAAARARSRFYDN